jgi:hypothetical protein
MAVKTQQLRSSTASKRPTSAALLDGELALCTDAGTPGLFFENGSAGTVKVGPCEVSGTAPNASPASGGATGNSSGEFWFDTGNGGGNSIDLLKVFNGSAFVSVGSVTIGSTNVELGAAAATTLSGLVEVNAGLVDLTNQGDARFHELTANGQNYIALQAPASIAADVVFTLPAADGTAGQVIQTDGNGVLSFGTDPDNDSITDGDTSVVVNGTSDTITFTVGGSDVIQLDASGNFVPVTDSTHSIGTTTNRWTTGFFDALTVGGNIAGTWNGGIISAAKGGTGLDGSSAGNGNLVIGNGSGYTLTTLTQGTGLTITNGSGSITLALADTAVSAAAYGSATAVANFTVDAQGRLTSASSTTISIPHTQVNDFDAGVQANTLNSMTVPDGAVDLNSQKITGLATPTADTDAANKAYVDTAVEGLDAKASCVVATTAALPAVTYNNGTAGVGATLTADANGAVTVDGVALDTVGERVLVKNQAAALQNGIYSVTTVGTGSAALVLTRTEDCDTAAEILHAFTFIEQGTANEDNGYTCTATEPITIGTTALPWTQFSGAGQITAGTGLTKNGNILNAIGTADRITANADSLDIASTYVGQTSITTLGTIATGTWNGSIVGTAYGGTGVDNSTGLTASYAFMAPNGSNGAASFREILTSDIAPTTGGSFDAGTY